MSRQPVLFVSHAAPPLLDDAAWTGALAAWGRTVRPSAILVVSAHWETRTLATSAPVTLPLVYDFYGFPQRFYAITYPAPGAPALAARVHALASAAGLAITAEPTRGLDHGTWVPLLSLFPEADVPVLQLSLPTLDPEPLLRLGRVLAPLRDEGVLVVGSGSMTHNLRELSFGAPAGQVAPWAQAFDTWAAEAVRRHDTAALLRWETAAPEARRAHPRSEHLAPLFVAAGAGGEDDVSFPVTGFRFGGLSLRAVAWGAPGTARG